MTPMPMSARMPMTSSPSLSASVSTSASTSTTPLKKSKRQAERMTKGAFAATRRKEKEEERLYHHHRHHHHHPPKPVPKKPKAAKRRSPQSKPESEHKSNRSANGTVDAAATNNSTSASASSTRNSTNGNVKPSLADGESEAFRKASQVVTPSPTQVPSSSSSPLPLSLPLSSTSTSTSSLKSQNAIEQSLTIQPSQTKAKKRSKGSLSSSLASSSHGKGEGGIVPLDKDDKMATISGSSNGNGSSMKHNRNHPTPNRRPKRRKIVYEATSGSKRPIDGYALDLVSLVCNNAYCVMTKTGGPHKPKNNNSNNKSTMSAAAAATATPSPKHKHKQKTLCFHSQPHRVLDRPSSGYTQESEPLKERLTRLQLRQRFASATSIGMSPIEFSIKLLKIWGGTLEQVYDEKKTVVAAAAGSTSTMASKKKVKAKTKTKSIGNSTNGGEKKNTAGMVVSSERNNNCSSLTLTQTQTMTPASESARSRFDEEIGFATISDGDGIKAAIEFDKCMGDLEPRSIHPNARVGERKTNGHGILVHRNGKNNANQEMYVPNHALSNNNVSINGNIINSNINFLQQPNNNVVNSDTNNHSGASMDRIERTKKLKQRRHRKNLKKAEALAAASSLTVDPRALPAAATSDATPSTSSKQKASKKVSRKFMEDPSLPVLFKDMRLSHPKDDSNLNALHCFVRSTLLEVYVIQCKRAKSTSGENDNKKASDEEPQNVVGIRCTQCGFLPREDRGKGQTMSSFFPKSVGEIYRGVCTWQRIHFPVCEHMPEDYRTEYKIRKERDLTRGRKYHWIKSALDMGLRNIDSKRNGMTYEPDLPYDLDEVLRLETDLGGRSRKSRGGGKKTKRSFSEIETKSEALMLSAKGASPGRGLAAPTFAEDEEFELFGDDFEKSLEESEEAAVTMGDESAF
jgi:hypothetical protein